MMCYGCGPFKAGEVTSLSDLPGDGGLGVLRYELEDPACQTGSQDITLEQAQVFMLTEHGVQPSVFTFGDHVSAEIQPSLRGTLLSETLYGLQQRLTCELDGDNLKCANQATTRKDAQPLRLCRLQGQYQRDSVEAVALTSFVGIERAYQFYLGLKNAPELPPARLVVLPLVEQSIADEAGSQELSRERIITKADNLGYVDDFESVPAFVVYPKSRMRLALKLWRDVNLWESPWILAHEFAHHAFRAAIQMPPQISVSEPAQDQKEQADTPDPKELGALISHELESYETKSWIALHEAFADLFAFYSVGGHDDDLVELDCFVGNRDVPISTFADGRPKKLSAEMMQVYYQGIAGEDAGSGCQIPRMTDPHIIGAALAHGMDQILRAALASQDKTFDPTVAGSLMLEWARSLPAYINSFDDEARLPRAARLWLTMVDDFAGGMTSETCAVARDVFPVLSQNSEDDQDRPCQE